MGYMEESPGPLAMIIYERLYRLVVRWAIYNPGHEKFSWATSHDESLKTLRLNGLHDPVHERFSWATSHAEFC